MNRMMLNTASWAACLLALSCGALPPLGAQVPATVPASAPAPHDDAYWKDLEDRLGSEDPKVRDAATKELDHVSWQEKPKLQERLEHTSDEQIKASLGARIDAIGEELATNPPPISIDLHEARLSEVAAAFKKEIGVSITTWPPDDNTRGPFYTLTLKDKPFWEIFTALSQQHSLMMQRSDRMQIMQAEPGLRKIVPASDGFFLFPGAITRSREVNLQAEPGQDTVNETMTIAYWLAVDPRVKVVSHNQPVLTEVIDDTGNELLKAPAPARLRRGNMAPQWQAGEPLFSASSSLKIPEKMGKRIASAKGEANFVLQVSEDVQVLEKPSEKLKQPLVMGAQTLTIDKFELGEQRINFGITTQPPNAPARRGGMPQTPTRMQVLDKTNQVIWETLVYGGTSGNIGVGENPGPFHLRFSAVTRTKDVTVTFELKDLPLP